MKSSKKSAATLFISKEFYEDTSIVIEPRHNQEITITMMPVEKEEDKVTVAPENYLVPDSIKAFKDTSSKTTAFPPVDSAKVERTGMGSSCFLPNKKSRALT
jgi:hypothetical protein